MRNRRGFTLIELLVVIAIIGILATLVITQLAGAQVRARNSNGKSDVTQIGKAIGVEVTNNATMGDKYYSSDARAGANSAGTRLNASTATGVWGTLFGTASADGSYNKLRISKSPSASQEYGYITDVTAAPGTAAASYYCIATSVSTASGVVDTAFYINNGASANSTATVPTYNTTGTCQ